jgi:4-amino-4-deoxy-L-arabinose transferase-like glycosyltransferase
VVIYTALSLYQINLPGLHYDEAFEAVPAMQLLQGQPVTAFRNSGLSINGQLFPYMTQDYIGATNTYAALPFIAVFGPTPAALRLMGIMVGLLTLGLTFGLTCQLTQSRWAGLIALSLLAVDPTFVFWSRQSIFVTAATAALGLAVTICWWQRGRGGSAKWSLAGAFLAGLGLYTKLLFLWLIVALIGAVVMLNWRSWLTKQFSTSGKVKAHNWLAEALRAGVAFMAGCWPLLAYNLQTGGTFLNVTQNAATSFYGVNNLAFGSNLIERIRQFFVLLSGSHLWYLGETITNPWPALAFGASLILTLGFWLKNNPVPEPGEFSSVQAVLFPFLVIGLVILASIGTVSGLWVTHFAVLMPWPAIAMSLAGWFSWSQVAGTRYQLFQGVLVAGLVLVLVTNLLNVIRYHGALTQSGGLSTHSDAVYDLSEWLANQAHGPVVAMDWGLAAPVTYLTNGQVTPTEVFGYVWQPDQELSDRLKRFMAQPTTLYLWRAPDEIIFDRSQGFKALYRPLNLQENIEAAFYERSGRPILGITRLVSQGTAVNPPQ